MKSSEKTENIGAVSEKDIQSHRPDKKNRNGKRKRKKAPVIIAVIVVIIVILRAVSCAAGSSGATVVTTTHALRGDLQESVSTSGTVLSEEVRVIFAPVGGTLAEVNVEAGDAVRAGDVLIGYDMEQMERTLLGAALQLQRSTAGYNGTLANDSENQARLSEATYNLVILEQQIADFEAYLKQLQDALNQSQRETNNGLLAAAYELEKQLNNVTPGSEEYLRLSSEMARIQYLQQVAGSSDYVVRMQAEIADVQEHLSACEAYKAQMESQKSASEAAVLDSYDRSQLNADKELADLSYQETERDYYIAKTGIVAEFDGIVTSCMAIPGEGVVSGTQLLTLESSENLKVSFDASQYDLEKLELGQQADVVISGRTYHGEISKINRMAERNASSTPMVGVEIHLLDADDNIILGMDARLSIYTRKVENALLIPVEVINADRDGDFLYVVEDGVIVRKSIVCGISTDTYTEVIQGITEEDVIVATSYGDLEEGMAVTVLSDESGSGASADGSGSGLTITIGQ